MGSSERVSCSGTIVQLCPHDTPPFDEICASFEQAGNELGIGVRTIYLSKPATQALPNAHYLNCTDLSDTQALVEGVNAADIAQASLVVCHRYRAYWAAVKSNVPNTRCVALAHEFGFFARWRRRLARQLFARGVRFAGVSAPVQAELRQTSHAATLLPNVLNTYELLDKDAALDRLGLQPGPTTVGVVGRLHYKKRPQLALEAFNALQQDAPMRLVFLGEGSQRSELEAQTNTNVHFLGNIERARETYRALDVLLHPGNSDAFGMVIAEAMFAGVPVVTGRGKGPEFILGELGCYAQADSAEGYAQALREAMQVDRDLYAAQARQRLQQEFSVAALAARLDELLKLAD